MVAALSTSLHFFSSHLEEYCEHNHCQSCGHKHLLWRDDPCRYHLHQREPHRPPEASVGHDELFLEVDLADATTVGQEGQAVDT